MKTIGIVGGVGSYAGIHLMTKICDYSGARSDQEHLPIHMISTPHQIGDRTQFLLGEIDENPADAMADIISRLQRGGAEIMAIPCNTAHAPPIFDKIKQSIPANCTLLHLVEEVGRHLATDHPGTKKVGVLATNGTFLGKVYPAALQRYGIDVVQPSRDIQFALVHPAIYDREYGIKAFPNPVAARAKENLATAVDHLKNQGVDAIILGCTELSIAFAKEDAEVILIDSISVLAKALIRESMAD